MPVIILVNNVWSKISGLKDVSIADSLDKITSFYVEGYQYTKAFTQGWFDPKTQKFRHWDGKKHLLTAKMVFPTGLLQLVKDFFINNKIDFIIDDKRGVFQSKEIPTFGKTPRQYQKDALDSAIKNERGIIRVATGGGKCLRIGTKVIKYDGSICNIEDVKSHDLLMGPDSKPRRVLSTNKQYGDIVKIIPTRGDPWFCNDIHILTLKHTVTNKIIDISIPEYLKKCKTFKHCYKQFSTGVDFVEQEKPISIDPYFLGLWFGDGNKTHSVVNKKSQISSVGITNIDKEVISYLYNVAEEYSCLIRKAQFKNKCPTYYFRSKIRKENNKLLYALRDILDEKNSIPRNYLVSSRKDRLEFLAGWIDSDGYLHNNGYEICQKREDWAKDIIFLARSLGFKVTINNKFNKKYGINYYRIGISGNVCEIPVRIVRKKASIRKQKKDPCKVGFKIEPAGQDYYVGIELDGDGRFLLGDFTVTHNTLIASMITAKYNLPTMIYVVGKDLLYQFHDEFKKTLNMDIGIIGDGKCEIKKFNICSVWTAITSFGLEQKVSLDDEDWSPEVFEIESEQKKIIKNAIESCNVSIYDEAHFLATDTLQAIYKAGKKCKYIFGLSGTDWRDDGADLLLESVCGPRIFNMPASNLIDEGFLTPANIVIFDVPTVMKLGNNYHSVYNAYITNNEIRNNMIVDSVRMLLDKGRRPLILVRYIKHGNIISKMLSDIPHYFVNGEINGEDRKNIKNDFEKGNLKCLIASSVYDIGIDIPCLDALVLCGSGKSTVRALQRIGRVIRSFYGKKDAIVVDFFDNAKYLDKHSAVRISVYETEPRFKIKFPKDFDNSKIKRSRKIIQRVTS